MKQFVYAFVIVAALAIPARAVTCAEGMKVIDQMSRILELSELERSSI